MIILLALLACNPPLDDSGDLEPLWSPPDEAGPWTPSTSEHPLTGSTGVELRLQVWFPATETDDEVYRYDGFVEGNALEDGVPDCSSSRPVVLFSHGNGGLRYQSWFLTEHLAAHGYLVVAPDHIGNTTYDVDTVPRSEMAIRRPQDITDAYDWLIDEASDPDSPLAGCAVASDGFAITGHSFGGYTTLAVAGATLDLDGLTTLCATTNDWICGVEEAWAAQFPDDDSGYLGDDRVWAAVPLAPIGAHGFGDGLAAIDDPTMVIGGFDDDMTTWAYEAKPIYDGLETIPRRLVGLDGVGHYTFTNFCISGLNGCDEDDMPLEEAHALLSTLVLAQLDVARGETRSTDWLPPEDDALTWEEVVE